MSDIFFSAAEYFVQSCFRIIPESIPWLVAKNRFKEAKEILKKAAKFNGIELPIEFQLSGEDTTLLKDNKVYMLITKSRGRIMYGCL